MNTRKGRHGHICTNCLEPMELADFLRLDHTCQKCWDDLEQNGYKLSSTTDHLPPDSKEMANE